jgi:hypothetical protein
MTTGDAVRDRALELARSDRDLDEAVRDLEEVCAGRRVAVVRARQLIEEAAPETDPVAARAVGFLDELLQRLPA